MSGKLKDKVAIVTGGGRGIGRGIVELFAAEGAKIVIATRTAKYGEEIRDECRRKGQIAEVVEVDIGTRRSAFDVVARSIALFGDLDIVVHNAAVFPFSFIEDLTEEDVDWTIDVNLKATIWLTQAALPHIKSKQSSGGGRLIYISTLAGTRLGVPGYVVYGASKAGINGFAKGAAAELAQYGVTVNCVEPGSTWSATFAKNFPTPEILAEVAAGIPLGRLIQPADIAQACLFFALPENSVVTGQVISVDGGASTGYRTMAGSGEHGGAPDAA